MKRTATAMLLAVGVLTGGCFRTDAVDRTLLSMNVMRIDTRPDHRDLPEIGGGFGDVSETGGAPGSC
jgi:hypothetical protein